MKTQNYGVSTKWVQVCGPYRVAGDYNINLCSMDGLFSAKGEAQETYFQNRANGNGVDNPSRPLPKDGYYTWEDSRSSSSRVRYTGGYKDGVWMTERDRNCIDRLKRERQAWADALNDTKLKSILSDITNNSVSVIDLSKIVETCVTDAQSSDWHTHSDLPSDLPPYDFAMRAFELEKLFQALQSNASVNTLNLAKSNLSQNVETLITLLAARTDFVSINLANTSLNEEALQRILNTLCHNSVVTDIDISPADNEVLARQTQTLISRNQRLAEKRNTNPAFSLYHLAALEGDLETLRTLLLDQSREEENALCGEGKAPLDYAYEQGHIGAILLLLGIEPPETPADNLETLLFQAAEMGWEKVVSVLYLRGQSLEGIDGAGNTLLHLAAKNGHDVLLQYLLFELTKLYDQNPTQARTFIEKKNAEGKSALDLANENLHTEVENHLKETLLRLRTQESEKKWQHVGSLCFKVGFFAVAVATAAVAAHYYYSSELRR